MSHDEIESRFWVISHEVGDDAFGFIFVAWSDFDAQEMSRSGVERRFIEGLRHHFAETFESRDLYLFNFFVIFTQQIVSFFFVEDPISFFSDIDAEEWGLSDVDATGIDEGSHLSVEEREQ